MRHNNPQLLTAIFCSIMVGVVLEYLSKSGRITDLGFNVAALVCGLVLYWIYKERSNDRG